MCITTTFLASCSKQNHGVEYKELNSTWKFRLVNDTLIPGLTNDFHDAYVPGCIHKDLFKNGIIEDPFYRDNESHLQWIENMDWEYSVSFDVDKNLIDKNNIELEFQGLDTYADVFLNDNKILFADNMFRTWKVDCEELLKKGENNLRIVFYSHVPIEKAKRDSLGFDLPDIRGFTRKAPYHYGWDWGPRFVTCGIWRPILLRAWNTPKIIDVNVVRTIIENDTAILNAGFEIQSDNDTLAELEIEILNDTSQVRKIQKSVSLKKGVNKITFDFNIPNPNLWWPNGMGNPYLYDLQTTLNIDDKIFDRSTIRFGIRTIELITEKDSIGESFFFRINDVPVSVKGANYIPQNSFVTEVSEDDYVTIIKSVVDANMNMLRVWGGGIYENDIFYDLCDENGIMVWQDFMFACNMYPGDYAFLENIRNEAIDNVRRLRNHPCLALWCGNNEVDEGWKNWGWQDQFNYSEEQCDYIWTSYQAIFHRLLPAIIKNYDPQTPYWPSSPKHGWGHEESMTEGDSHYWGVWWGEEPFEKYEEKVGRFMSEYGFQGYPGINTVEKFTNEPDRELDSKVMRVHQKHPRGHELVKTYMARDYSVPDDFNSFLYLSQLLQAEGVKTAIEAHRRAKPYCMGTLYWQLNDCWPVASWSSIDYYGRWKALHYFVRDAYKTFLISVDENNGLLEVYVVSDSVNEIEAILDVQLMTFDGKVLSEEKVKATIPGLSSGVYYSTRLNELLSSVGIIEKNSVFLRLLLSKNDIELAQNIHYFVKPKYLALKPANIETKISKVNDHWEIELSCDRLAKNVYVRVEGDDGFFSDNYFDLLPLVKKKVKYYPENYQLDLKDALVIRTLADLIR